MDTDAASQDFVLTIRDVFTVTGRGTVIAGTIESGTLRTGDLIEIWDGGQLVATASATIDLACAAGTARAAPLPNLIGLVLGDVEMSLLGAGQTVRKSATSTPVS